MKLGTMEMRDSERADLSQLLRPLDTSPCSLKQIAQLLEKGSSEVQDILTHECDTIFECRICRSLFRSLTNLISHKRVYCRDKYRIEAVRNTTTSVDSSNKKSSSEDMGSDESFSHEECSKGEEAKSNSKRDITSFMDMLVRKQSCGLQFNRLSGAKHMNYSLYGPNDKEKASAETNKVVCTKENSAVGGNERQSPPVVTSNNENPETNSRYSTTDNQNGTANRNPNSGGKLVCTPCNLHFPTRYTLLSHIKSKHKIQRLRLRCTRCSCTFPDRSSVYRHLFKVHRMSNDDVRKVRSQIQAKLYRENTLDLTDATKTTIASDPESTKETQSNRSGITLQESIENLALDPEPQEFDEKTNSNLSRKVFTEKAANDTCYEFSNQRITMKNTPLRGPSESNEPTEHNSVAPDKKTEKFPIAAKRKMEISNIQQIPEIKTNSGDEKRAMETAIRVEDVSSLSKDVWDKIGVEHGAVSNQDASESSTKTNSKLPLRSVSTKISEGSLDGKESKKIAESSLPESSNVSAVIYTTMDNSEPVALTVLDRNQKLGIKYRGIQLPTVTLEKINVPLKSCVNLATFESPVSSSASLTGSKQTEMNGRLVLPNEAKEFPCSHCNRSFSSRQSLHRHKTVHRKRCRYRCRLCDFKTFFKCDCIAHCNKKHDAKNNRKILSELIIEIQFGKEAIDNETIKQETGQKKELEVIDVIQEGSDVEERTKQVLENVQSENREKKTLIPLTVRQICPISNGSCSEVKRKRGRPPKLKKGRNKKSTENPSIGKKRCLSLPVVKQELPDILEMEKSSEGDESSSLLEAAKLECGPELRKMVMEVIFGPSDKETSEDTQEESTENSEDVVSVKELEGEPKELKGVLDQDK